MMGTPKRGRQKKSIEERRAEGTYRADRHGRTGPKSDGKPVKPLHLKGEAAAFWDANVPRLEQMGCACDVDTAALTSMCEWWAEYRSACDETIENENALLVLASKIDDLGTLALLGSIDDVVSEMSARVLETIGELMERRSMQAKRRVERMSRAWREFFSIASRFGMTAVDRQAIDNMDPSEGRAGDPIEERINRSRRMTIKFGEGANAG